MWKVLVTCPPMLQQIGQFSADFTRVGFDVTALDVVQTVSEDDLASMISGFDGWIIGDDPATARVFHSGANGRLKAAVKWGIGVDNVDFAAAEAHGILIANTPDMFGAEVADLAMHYVVALARETYQIDRGVREGNWPKPTGCSLAGRTVGLIGYGNIGQNFCKRAIAADMDVIVYDPGFNTKTADPYTIRNWPNDLDNCDFVVLTCALTKSSYHIINDHSISLMKPGVRLVNVARGALVDETALLAALSSRKVDAAALEVFETEPLPSSSDFRNHERCVFGSHNASNTVDAVGRASLQAINVLSDFLGK